MAENKLKSTKPLGKRVTPLGWVVGVILVVVFFASFFMLASCFEDFFFTNMGLETFIGIMIGFFIWYAIFMVITLVLLKLGGEKLVRK